MQPDVGGWGDFLRVRSSSRFDLVPAKNQKEWGAQVDSRGGRWCHEDLCKAKRRGGREVGAVCEPLTWTCADKRTAG